MNSTDMSVTRIEASPTIRGAVAVARQCRHYAMCKIDCVGTGLCVAGRTHGFASHWPQGRMDLVRALVDRSLPFTEGLARIADSCDLCGICDRQCHFVTGLRPMDAMRALKEHVAARRAAGEIPLPPEADPLVDELAAVLSPERVTNDTADLVAYADDPGPVLLPKLPRAVVLPATIEEVQAVARMCSAQGVAMVARGNGASAMGFTITDGVQVDTRLLRTLEVDEGRWLARVGAGISAFEVQAAAQARGLRANTAEPAALVCANIACSGLFSTFSHAYGTGADNYVSATFVQLDGTRFSTSDPDAPNVFGFRAVDASPRGLCVEAEIRLHPASEDEEGVLVPFSSLKEALRFARELGVRRIGLAVGVLGGEYLTVFAAPTVALATAAKEVFTRTLGIAYVVLAIGDRFARAAIRELAPFVIDQKLFRTLTLGLPRLASGGARDLLESYEGDRPLYEVLCRPELGPLLDVALEPSPQTLAEVVDPDLRGWYAKLYARPELTDLVWLNTQRIVSSRIGREKNLFPIIAYAPLEPPEVLDRLSAEIRAIGDRHGLKHDFGFVTPLDLGKRAVFEYDYYFDHTNDAEVETIRRAMPEIAELVLRFEREFVGVRWIRWTLHQGYARSEALLYT